MLSCDIECLAKSKEAAMSEKTYKKILLGGDILAGITFVVFTSGMLANIFF